MNFADLVRSEWTKLRSVRSTWVGATLVVLAMMTVSVAITIRWSSEKGPIPDWFDPTNLSLSGVYLAQVVVGVLGVLVISSEYGTGLIRTTLAATPQRRELLAAKAVVVAGTTLVLGEITAFTAFWVGQAILARHHLGVSIGDPGVLRAVGGSGLFLTAMALLGFGLGATVRHTAGAISALFGIVFALDAVLDLFPTSWRNAVIDYLPLNAGSQIFTLVNVKGALAPWTGLGVLALYAAAAVAAGVALIGVRDV